MTEAERTELERLKRIEAAYLKLLEVGRAWARFRDSLPVSPCCCGRCAACTLALLIENAEPCLPHSYCDGKRQGMGKTNGDHAEAMG